MAHTIIAFQPVPNGAGSTEGQLAVDTTTGANAELPKNKAGQFPKYVVVQMFSSNFARIAFGDSGVTTAANVHFVIGRDTGPMVFSTAGITHIAWASLSGGSMYVTALENDGGWPTSSPSEV